MSCSRVLFFLISSLVPLAVAAQSPLPEQSTDKDPLVIEGVQSPHEWSPGQNAFLTFRMSLPEKFHAYVDKFAVRILEPDGFLMGAIKVEPTKSFHDKFSGKTRLGFQNRGDLTLPVEAPSRWLKPGDRLVVEFVYQACSDTFCLFPTTKTLNVPATLIGAPPAESADETDLPTLAPSSWLSIERLQDLLGESKALALFFVFLAGILTSFTPCIFPMIPITLAVLGHHAESRTRAQNFLLSLFYVHGIAFTYSMLGIAAATSGAVFGASLGNPWVLGLICALLLIMSLSMYGLFEIQVPSVLRNSLGSKKTAPGYGGAFLSGLIAGVVASPCVGPVLVAILAYVATTGSKLYGFVLLFTYAMGLGLIFLILGLFTNLARRLPRSGPWLDSIKFILGSLMLGAFYYYLGLLLPARWHDGTLALGLIVLGSLAGAFLPLKGTRPIHKIRKGAAQAILFIGFGYLALAVFDLRPLLQDRMVAPAGRIEGTFRWQNYSEAALEQAQQEGRAVLIDFWAEWCAACHELEKHTFADPRVAVLAEKFTLLRYDATRSSEELKALKARWKIQGLPTVLFIDPQGQWREELTLTEFERADPFLRRMNKALK